ncbi:MAG: hypothetical protein JXB32_16695 [Deltaproteobacteria bacterium]|nr:hypothetical protein [Deltaproteobacteria bacterium]
MRTGTAGSTTVGIFALAATLVVAAGGLTAATDPASGPSGCWVTEAGERFEFARGEDGVLRVTPSGAGATGCGAPIDTLYVPETGQTCFWAPPCMSGVDAFCLEPGESPDEWTLIRRAWDHARILRDRSHGSHPLGEVSSAPLARCP